MIRKIVDFEKLKGYPQNAYAFLWVILCVVVALVHLTAAVLISKSVGSKVSAASGSAVSACTFSPGSVDVGKSINVWANNANVSGPITIQGAYLATATSIGSLPKKGSVTALIPSVQSGLYVVRVNGTNCKTSTGGDLAVQNVIPTPTPVPVGANNLTVTNQTCTTDGKVNVAFHWTPQPDGSFFKKGAQWLDLSAANGADPFSTGNYLSHNVFGMDSYTTSTATGNISPLAPGMGYYWRINTLNSLNSSWYPSATSQFASINCAIPLPSPTPIAAACTVTPSAINLGGSINVAGRGFTGLTYSANLLGFSTTQFYNLGPFNGNTGTYIIPATVSSGVYTVRIFSGSSGDNGVICTPDLVIS